MTDEAKKELIKALAKGNPELQINIDCNDVCFKKEMQQEPATQQKTAEEAEYCDYEEVCDEEATPQTVKNEPAPKATADIIEQLMACFSRDVADPRDAATTFYRGVLDLDDAEITDLVAKMKLAGNLRETACNKKLWNILHENGLYQASLSNWNTRLRTSPY